MRRKLRRLTVVFASAEQFGEPHKTFPEKVKSINLVTVFVAVYTQGQIAMEAEVQICESGHDLK
jgi:hypothetical protein